ncbi:porin [Methylomonas sp. AM2-LC]|uniref:porin n=1 Tax=Methylomonas sp. AM2-LC TaxID=3153301 RepID=UPI003266FC71
MIHFRRHVLVSAIALALIDIPTTFAANNEALEQRIRELESRLEKFEKATSKEAVTTQPNPEVEKLNTKVNTLERKLEVEKEVATANASNSPKVEAGPEGFRISSQDGKHQLRIRGAVQTDGRFWINDHGGANGPVNYTTGSGIPDSFQLRQARIWLEGKLWNSLYFKIMPDFASSSNILPDAYLDYAYVPFASFTAGKQKTPLSLERLQGDSETMFLERAYPTYLANNRDVGIMLHGEFAKPGYKTEYGGPVDFKNFISYQLGVFNGSGDNGSSNYNAPATFDDKEFDGRIWAHPFQHAGIAWLEGLGLGVAGSWSHPNQLALNKLVSALGQSTFLDYSQNRAGATAPIAEGIHTRIYPQAYWYNGPFGLQGEYVVSNQQLTGNYNSKLTQISQSNSAWQVQASYVLTGEDNTFQSVKPFKPFDPLAGNWGALQIAGRYSELNVDTTTFKFIDPTRGARDAASWTIGFNWFLNRNALIRADYEETNYLGGAGSILSGTGVNTKYAIANRPTERVFATRFQLSF